MNNRSLILFGIILLLFLALFAFGPRRNITNYPSNGTDIIAYGDSLIEGVGSTAGGGFVSILSNKIGRPIINLGHKGDTTYEGLERIRVVDNYNPKVVILLLGGNDYLKKISKDETEINLAKLIKSFQSKGAIVVLLGVRGGLIQDNFKSMYKRLSKQYGTAYVDDVLSGLIWNTNYMSDAVHPNDAGYALIAQKVYPILDKVIR